MGVAHRQDTDFDRLSPRPTCVRLVSPVPEPAVMNVSVQSEISELRRVLVHRPDSGVSRVTPKRSDELLFDDIVYLPRMQAEHDVFTAVLRAFCGEDAVLEYADLLEEAIEASGKQVSELVASVLAYAELPQSVGEFLLGLSPKHLASLLITGYHEPTDRILFDPIPNFIFTRDLAITVNNHVVLAKAATEARSRENFIVRFIFEVHPSFKELRERNGIIDLNDVEQFAPSHRGDHVRVEGGDVMLLNESYLLIGISERTNEHTADLIAEALFAKEVIDNVVKVVIPADRAYMHLDTIFTQVNHDLYTAYAPIINAGESSRVVVMSAHGTRRLYPSVEEFVLAEINADARFIASGGGVSPYQEREQWTDACNLVALRPGIAITYDRNQKTAAEFERAGYEVVPAEQVIDELHSGARNLDTSAKLIITLPSAELSRARGGGHCMTCPLERA